MYGEFLGVLLTFFSLSKKSLIDKGGLITGPPRLQAGSHFSPFPLAFLT